MEKKNPYKFTIGFKKQLPFHQRAAEILNQTADKAELIAAAILQYMGETPGNRNTSMEELRPWIIELVRKEVKNVAGPEPAEKTENREEQVLNLSDKKEMPDHDLAMNLMGLMNSFRRD